MCVLHHRQGNSGKAKWYCQQSLNISPNSSSLLYDVALMYLGKENIAL